MRTVSILVISAFFIFTTYVATAQNSSHGIHNKKGNHFNLGITLKTVPLETGQDAFSAIAEIVDLLTLNPNTNWFNVDIDALREHLVDMNQLTLNAKASKKLEGNKVVFTVTGEGATLKAINRMVPAHALQLSVSTNWKADTQLNTNGVTLTINSEDSTEINKIFALGFFGVMATGNHHQEHHYQMAKGDSHSH